MPEDRTSCSLVWFSLAGVLVLGVFVALMGDLWGPALAATSVDAILTPEELRDPKFVEIVYRAHTYNEPRWGSLVVPYRFTGASIALLAVAGMIGFKQHGTRDNPPS